MVRILKSKSGFTLIELLVTVAIVGILATAGIPTYKKMMSRAKQSEPKVYLGAVAMAESATQAEYNSFGNDLAAMAVEANNGVAGGIYISGFMTGACAAAAYSPTVATMTGLGFTSYGAVATAITRTAIGNTGLVNLSAAECANQSSVAPTATTFTATAVGRVNNLAPTATTSDIWSMNTAGVLSNPQSGVQ